MKSVIFIPTESDTVFNGLLRNGSKLKVTTPRSIVELDDESADGLIENTDVFFDAEETLVDEAESLKKGEKLKPVFTEGNPRKPVEFEIPGKRKRTPSNKKASK